MNLLTEPFLETVVNAYMKWEGRNGSHLKINLFVKRESEKNGIQMG